MRIPPDPSGAAEDADTVPMRPRRPMPSVEASDFLEGIRAARDAELRGLRRLRELIAAQEARSPRHRAEEVHPG
jgi:hypothetical protein